MNYRHNIGLHLRLKDCLLDLIKQAQHYELKSFQFFLTSPQLNDKYLYVSAQDQKQFLQLKRDHFAELYIHSSYWINPATGKKDSFEVSQKLLQKEIALAKKLEVKHIILHPGSAVGHQPTTQDPDCKQQGITTVATMLNNILKHEHDVTILLENTAHANRTVGSDFNDFTALKKLLDHPEKIGYCVDLAHAFSYGYDLADAANFVQLLDTSLGTENIKLIHLNDAREHRASRQDHHEIPGNGQIGKQTLQNIINHPQLVPIPKIIELPLGAEDHIHKTLNIIRSW